MERLTLGRRGQELARSSTVGWVYWGCLFHVAREKLQTHVDESEGPPFGETAYFALREAQAFENLHELYSQPEPLFTEVARRLAVAGIRAELHGERLQLRFAPPEGGTLVLARPARHPWLREHELTQV